MKCSNCGAFNEDYMEYCENCASPLVLDQAAPTPASAPETGPYDTPAPQSSAAAAPEAQASWGFVQAPRWIQPEFDANTISEEDIPADFHAAKYPLPPSAAAFAPCSAR